MELLRALMKLQEERGFLDDETLRELSKRRNTPLYRLEGLVSFYPVFRRRRPPRKTMDVCRDVTCAMAGCDERSGRLREQYRGRDDIEIREVSCLGRCEQAPAAALNEQPLPAATLEQWIAWADGEPPPPAARPRRTWQCDPYQQPDDYYATAEAFHTRPEEILERLSQSGLRGMGGAGFPTGKKWELVRNEPSATKYVICNADESEPGTFKDRVILDELPHLVIEGMLLAGLTIGAETGIVYLRHEYGPERRSLEAALEEARRQGALGADACGSGKSFEIEIFDSPGGYILGEETALLEALEDKRGEPRNKPPYPGQVGLWGKPTLINNVETFALATTIVQRGVDWWRATADEGFAGLKFVSVSGDVVRPGVYEIPLGTTVNELIAIAGGMVEQPLQAFLPGGASSNFLPAELADTPLDFDAMKKAGSMLGTGAVIVIDRRRDLFELATNIVRFFRNESCGKCVPCRIGSEQAVAMLEGVAAGEFSSERLKVLPQLGETLEQTSICGLGQVALNPILSLLANIPEAVPEGLR